MRVSASMRVLVVVAIALILSPLLLDRLTHNPALAFRPGNDAFERTWARTDRAMTEGETARTWMWGPEGNTVILDEPYVESPDGLRQVQYFDKSRMELTHPDAPDDGLWYVTNGLLVVELVTGRMQVGDSAYEVRVPAQVNVAGDPGDPSSPTYATFGALLQYPALGDGASIVQRLSRDGVVSEDQSLARHGVVAGYYVPETGHRVAGPFWAFMTSRGLIYDAGEYREDYLFINPFYATGYPIAEAYWVHVRVGGTPKDVLVQCFERRCLTYTPDNPPGWQVEAGNVGQHYYQWRYGQTLPDPTPTPAPTASPTPTSLPTAPATLSPTPTPTPTPLPAPFPWPEAECLNEQEATLLDLINAYRAGQQPPLSPLQLSVRLNRSAYGYSYDMGDRNYYFYPLSQDTKEPYPDWLGGPAVQDRIERQGYTDYTIVQENIAAGFSFSTGQAVFNAWSGSSSHRSKMLAADVTQIGIGQAYAPGSEYTYYWTTDFGSGSDAAMASCS